MSGTYTDNGYEHYIWTNPWDQKLLEKIREEKEEEDKNEKDIDKSK